MRVFNVQPAARPVYYDRNPINRTQWYLAGGVAPHGGTSRFSYVVPANKKAFLEMASLAIIRNTAATGAGLTSAAISYVPSGGAQQDMLYAQFINLNQGASDKNGLAQMGELGPGDGVSSFTTDGSTGGTNQYNIATKIQEFDA